MGFSITNKYLIRMKRNLHFWMLATILIISGAMQAQNHKNHPVDVRMEFYKLENDDNVDKNSYSLFTYLDADGTFGYYLGLGKAETFVELSIGSSDLAFGNYDEASIYLGTNNDEACATLESILALYDQDLETTNKFEGRACTLGPNLGGPISVTCTVKKKPFSIFGDKRLEFLYPCTDKTAQTFLLKSELKQIRNGLTFDKKLHGER